MKAAVLYQVPDLVIDEVGIRPPKTGEVLVKMAAAGVCHSDLGRLQGKMKSPYPIVLGHEGSGTVVDVGHGVTKLAPGDRVSLSWITPCGSCYYCLTGNPQLCLQAANMNSSGKMIDGTTRLYKGDLDINHHNGLSTFAEYAVVNENACVPIPPQVSLEAAALVGCAVMTGIGAVINKAKVTPGSTVAVYGVGGVGLNCIQGALVSGAASIIAVDTVDWKLELAKEFGATACINAKNEEPVEKIKKLTGNFGVDYAFDSVGAPVTVQQAYDSLRRGGMAVVTGIIPGKVSLNSMELAPSEKVLTGSLYGGARPQVDFPRILNLYLAKKIKLDEMITKRYRLDQIHEAFKDLEEGKLARGIIVFQ